MITSVADIRNPFFIGIAGAGMSAIALYLQGIGCNVSGSDRFFSEGGASEIKEKLENQGIHCYPQNGTGLSAVNDCVIVSTAIEDTVEEVVLAKKIGIPILKRSGLLALIAKSKKTIAVGGTSGKSTTAAMLFDILETAGLQPGIISGAGLVKLIEKGLLGNAVVGNGDWLVIEADESDGSITQYEPEIGLLLNVDKDHKEIDELLNIFQIFQQNSRRFIVNRHNHLSKSLSVNANADFSTDENDGAGIWAFGFQQQGFQIQFKVGAVNFEIPIIGRHNMENALAAVAVAAQIGIPMETCSTALKNYKGIYRRMQVLGHKNGVWVIDDFAHNPVKCAAAIEACKPVAAKVIAWLQPHGYGPTRFLKNDYIAALTATLRPEDEIWMSEIFYAGGTAVKNISAGDLIEGVVANGKKAFFVENRNDLLQALRPHLTEGTVLLMMGARDPSLQEFIKELYNNL